jgi:FKBP-type peptidyl-prolyl cis-trans isomerase
MSKNRTEESECGAVMEDVVGRLMLWISVKRLCRIAQNPCWTGFGGVPSFPPSHHTTMIRLLISGILMTSFAALASAQTPAAEVTTPPAEAPPAPKLDPAVIKTDSSYALGYRTGNSFSQQFGSFGIGADDLDRENFINGFMAAVKGDKPELAEEKLQAAMQAFGDLLQAREKTAAAANLEAGNKFLAENAKREGIVTTKSGLQYEIINKGGETKYVAPKEGEEDNKQFMVHYKGTLIDGTQFDASPEGKPVPMTLQVVEGFKEALTTMPVGAKWKLYLPAKLAYGEERGSAQIGPNSALIFDLELVAIEDAPALQGLPFELPQGQPE